jgi:hypothetical protein
MRLLAAHKTAFRTRCWLACPRGGSRICALARPQGRCACHGLFTGGKRLSPLLNGKEQCRMVVASRSADNALDPLWRESCE